MSILRRLGICWAFLVVAAPFPQASEKPLAKVRFLLEEPTYTKDFSASEIDRLESALASSLAGKLAGEFRFLEFSSQPSDSADAEVVFALRRKDKTAEGQLQEVGFHITITEVEGCSNKKVYWTFRPEEVFNEWTGLPDEFQAEIELKLNLGQSEGNEIIDYSQLVPELLSCIPIAMAPQGDLFKEEINGETLLGWLIPFRRSELCLGGQSELLIAAELRKALGSSSRVFKAVADTDFDPIFEISENLKKYHKHILCDVSNHPESQELATALEVLVKAIYVAKYLLNPDACPPEPDPPQSGDFQTGG